MTSSELLYRCNFMLTLNGCENHDILVKLMTVSLVLYAVLAAALLLSLVLYIQQGLWQGLYVYREGVFQPRSNECLLFFTTIYIILRLAHVAILLTNVASQMWFRHFFEAFGWGWGCAGLVLFLGSSINAIPKTFKLPLYRPSPTSLYYVMAGFPLYSLLIVTPIALAAGLVLDAGHEQAWYILYTLEYVFYGLWVLGMAIFGSLYTWLFHKSVKPVLNSPVVSVSVTHEVKRTARIVTLTGINISIGMTYTSPFWATWGALHLQIAKYVGGLYYLVLVVWYLVCNVVVVAGFVVVIDIKLYRHMCHDASASNSQRSSSRGRTHSSSGGTYIKVPKSMVVTNLDSNQPFKVFVETDISSTIYLTKPDSSSDEMVIMPNEGLVEDPLKPATAIVRS